MVIAHLPLYARLALSKVEHSDLFCFGLDFTHAVHFLFSTASKFNEQLSPYTGNKPLANLLRVKVSKETVVLHWWG